MRWPWWPPPSPGDVVALIVCAVIGVIFLFALAKYPQIAMGTNRSLGLGWNCTTLPGSEPVCVKSVPVNPSNNPARPN
jgi:hypothetical protein